MEDPSVTLAEIEDQLEEIKEEEGNRERNLKKGKQTNKRYSLRARCLFSPK